MAALATKPAVQAPEKPQRRKRENPVPYLRRKRLARMGDRVPTIRGLSEYGEELGMPFAPLRGKRMLDLGAGTGRFGYLSRKILGIDVVSLDYAFTESFEIPKAIFEDTSAKVRGFGEVLPFRDGSFDAVVSCYGPLFHFRLNYVDGNTSGRYARRGLRKLLREAIRVLRPGGEARMSCQSEDLRDIRAAMRSIAARHLEVSWEVPVREAEGTTLRIVKRG